MNYVKLHLGCGVRNFGPSWDHIDLSQHSHIDSHDVRSLPYKDDSVDIIYNCGLLQYFDDLEIPSILREWNRVLKIGSTLRISNPDFQVIAKLYSNKKYPLSSFIGPLFGRWDTGDSEYVYCKNAFDEPKLFSFLDGGGFSDIKRYDWRDTDHAHIDDYSQAYLPHMDKDNGELIMLNLECIKKG
jgi:hypothetical protein